MTCIVYGIANCDTVKKARYCAGFSDAGIAVGTTGLGPASEKRQGTKSRAIWLSG